MTSIINLKPIKNKLPEVLFYKVPKVYITRPPQTEFVAFSTNDNKNLGWLLIHKTNLKLRNDYDGDTLAIDFIASREPHKGLGKNMIEFAKNYSKQLGCNGYLILKAVNFLNKNEVPHIFYRKQGFSTLDENYDKILDSYIEKNLKATSKDLGTEIMYYPPKKKENRFIDNLFSFIKNIKNFF